MPLAHAGHWLPYTLPTVVVLLAVVIGAIRERRGGTTPRRCRPRAPVRGTPRGTPERLRGWLRPRRSRSRAAASTPRRRRRRASPSSGTGGRRDGRRRTRP